MYIYIYICVCVCVCVSVSVCVYVCLSLSLAHTQTHFLRSMGAGHRHTSAHVRGRPPLRSPPGICPGVDAGQLQKSISQISGKIHAISGDSGTWSTNSVLHVMDCLLQLPHGPPHRHSCSRASSASASSRSSLRFVSYERGTPVGALQPKEHTLTPNTQFSQESSRYEVLGQLGQDESASG